MSFALCGQRGNEGGEHIGKRHNEISENHLNRVAEGTGAGGSPWGSRTVVHMYVLGRTL